MAIIVIKKRMGTLNGLANEKSVLRVKTVFLLYPTNEIEKASNGGVKTYVKWRKER